MSKIVKNLLLIESPAKQKTIGKILGKDFKIMASYGHIRDLPKSNLGFDPDNDFKPNYVILNDKRKVVKDMLDSIGPDTVVYLASDDDAEGEAIAWHLYHVLKKKTNNFKRMVFHEITAPAIKKALTDTREISIPRVDAQQARRILDRAVGFTLSPLLWKKIKYGLSAGRVQSAALRIIVDREDEIEAFDPEEFWKHHLHINHNGSKFTSLLHKVDNKVSKITNEKDAKVIKEDCDNSTYILDTVETKDGVRKPAPPFTTSTIQQEASRKLGFSPKLTMSVAQKLYEGNMRVPGHTGGLITYMRTDAVNLSEVAIKDIKEVITNTFGNENNIPYIRKYKTKSKGAQEAHEAIRPTNMNLKPSEIERYLEPKEYKLYSLIWKRTIATQMAEAKTANTTYKILGGSKKNYEFIAKGTKILFPGFMLAYVEGNDDPTQAMSNDEKILPNIEAGTTLTDTELKIEQNFTKPPARYTEASLVKKLESEGIGRPSTYASTIATITTRGYVEFNKDKRLIPTVIGSVVIKYLVENFSNIVDLKFTSNMEDNFDKIAEGNMRWQDVLHGFYDDFVKVVDSKVDGERVQYSEARTIGIDKETGKDILVKTGMYGTYISIGEPDKEAGYKPKMSPVPKGVNPKEITLEDAMYYLRVPRVLGSIKDKDVTVGIGRFGGFLKWSGKYYSVKKNEEYDVYTITLEQAKIVIEEIDEAKRKSLLARFEDADISILIGRYGSYIKQGKKNYKLPKGTTNEDASKLTLEEVKEIIKNGPSKNKRK